MPGKAFSRFWRTSPTVLPAAVCFLGELLHDVFRNVVLRLDDHRAERGIVGVCGAAVVQRHGKEADATKCFAVRRDLLQMPAQRFLALVDAADDLKRRSDGCSRSIGPAARGRFEAMNCHGVECLIAKPPLQRQMVNSTPLESGKGPDFPGKSLIAERGDSMVCNDRGAPLDLPAFSPPGRDFSGEFNENRLRQRGYGTS